MPENEIESMSYESAYAALQQVITRLETEALPLEETLALYTQGQAYVKHCSDLLKKAELTIETFLDRGNLSNEMPEDKE